MNCGRRGVTDVHYRLPWIVDELMSSSATYETTVDQCYDASFIEEVANEGPTEHFFSWSDRMPVDGWTANIERGYIKPSSEPVGRLSWLGVYIVHSVHAKSRIVARFRRRHLPHLGKMKSVCVCYLTALLAFRLHSVGNSCMNERWELEEI